MLGCCLDKPTRLPNCSAAVHATFNPMVGAAEGSTTLVSVDNFTPTSLHSGRAEMRKQPMTIVMTFLFYGRAPLFWRHRCLPWAGLGIGTCTCMLAPILSSRRRGAPSGLPTQGLHHFKLQGKIERVRCIVAERVRQCLCFMFLSPRTPG